MRFPNLRRFAIRYPSPASGTLADTYTVWLLSLLGDCPNLEDLYVVRGTWQTLPLQLRAFFNRMRWPRLMRLHLGTSDIRINDDIAEFMTAHSNLEYLHITFNEWSLPPVGWTDGLQNLKALYIHDYVPYAPRATFR